MYVGLHVKCLLLLPNFNQLCFLHRFCNTPTPHPLTKYHEIQLSGAEVSLADRLTDTQT